VLHRRRRRRGGSSGQRSPNNDLGPFSSPAGPRPSCVPPGGSRAREAPTGRAGAAAGAPSTLPPPAARSAAGQARPARERNPVAAAAAAAEGGSGRGGGLPRGGGAGCRRRRRWATFAPRGWFLCRVGGRVRASPPSLLAGASPAALRPVGAGPSGGAAALFRAASSPFRGSRARPPPPLSPPRGAPGAPCRRSSCRTSFSARRTRPSGGGCWCLH
jgi:hypothetical protein